MTRKFPVKRLAISTRSLRNASGDESSGIENSWFALLDEFFPSATIHLVPNVPDQLPAWLRQVSPDFIILSGGEDFGSNPLRDSTESQLIEYGRSVGILGVCRGMQVLNNFFGGTLHVNHSDSHINLHHEVKLLARDFHTVSDVISLVKCFHRNFIFPSDLAPGLQTRALASDKSIEAISHPSEPILGIQWHPERADFSDQVFSLLLDELFGDAL